jgi:hypothetical protein
MTRSSLLHAALAAIGAAGIGIAAFIVLLGPARGHDIYGGVRDHRGVLCCGGDPVTGDCEALEAEQIQHRPDGSVRMFSRRWGAWITVAGGTVLPTAIPGDGGAAGHYCGRPRGQVGQDGVAPTAEQPDAAFWTYCAFVAPGGV